MATAAGRARTEGAARRTVGGDPAGGAGAKRRGRETLVVSDLHLGSGSGADVLRGDGPARDGLLTGLEGIGRLVIAGDLLELRQAPPRTVLERARPALRAIGSRLGPDAEVLVLAGNHDHRLVRPWLDRRGLRGEELELTASADAEEVSPIAAAIAEALGPARTRIAYPAAWLVAPTASAGGVLVMHGHYQDALWRIPTVERLVAGVVGLAQGRRGETPTTPGEFERLLAPGYGWMDGMAEHAQGRTATASQGASAGAWRHLQTRRSWRGRLLRRGAPSAIGLLTRAGLGDLEPHLGPETLRIGGLRGAAAVVSALGVRADHVIVGHTHRAGPLPGDAAWEWRLEHGGRLWNSGCWVHETLLSGGGPRSAYWPGRAVRIGADGVPRLVGLLDDVAEPGAAVLS